MCLPVQNLNDTQHINKRQHTYINDKTIYAGITIHALGIHWVSVLHVERETTDIANPATQNCICSEWTTTITRSKKAKRNVAKKMKSDMKQAKNFEKSYNKVVEKDCCDSYDFSVSNSVSERETEFSMSVMMVVFYIVSCMRSFAWKCFALFFFVLLSRTIFAWKIFFTIFHRLYFFLFGYVYVCA